MAQHFANKYYDVALSTRNQTKRESLTECNITPYLVDIDDLNDDCSDFFNATTLIINITSKNYQSFKNLISRIESSPIKQLIFVSSSSVYKMTNGIVTEDSDDENIDSILFQIESLFRQNKQFKTTILRLSGLVGYSRHPGKFFLNGKHVEQADTPVNLIHRDDCIGIIDAIIEQNAWGEIFNGCADSHPTKRLFYSHASNLLGLPQPTFVESKNCDFKIVSNEKVKQQLGYHFIYPDLMTIAFGNNA